MKLCEAIQSMKEGKQVKRAGWTYEDGYLTIMQGMKHVWKIILSPAPNAGNHIFSIEEVEADDWMLFDHAVEFEAKNAKCENQANCS